MKNNLKYYIIKALNEGFALGAINFNNMETLQGIVNACMKENSPAIISVSEGALNYMGDNYVIALANAAKKEFPYLFLHLDHGKSFDICKHAVDLGFDSVMIDGSSLSFEENIKLTKEVCEYAHKYNVLVEGELGQIKGIEDNVSVNEHIYTDPNKAKEFVDKTSVDTLAVAIGTSHGAYKYKGKQELKFDILEKIEEQLPNFPLVLHGASTIEPQIVEKFNQFGGSLKNAIGIPKQLLQEAVTKHNIIKINTDTDVRLSMTSEVRKILKENPNEFDLRKYLGAGRNLVTETISKKINEIFMSKDKI